MSDDTPLLNLPLLQPAQAQKHVTHNEALRLLDITVQLAVLDRDLNTPPATPTEGDRYIIGPAPTGAWAGRAGQIAAFWGGLWAYVAPGDGWQACILDESVVAIHQGSVWTVPSNLPETTPRLGIAATPDATNRFAVTSPATLLSHAGSDHRLSINKATAADTASVTLQTAFSTRAEIGLTGNDALALKVSPDGTAFTTALSADPLTGRLSTPQGLTAPLLLCDATDPQRSATIAISDLTPGAPRSYSLPDISSELATLSGSQTFDGAKTFSGSMTATGTTIALGTSTANAGYSLGKGTTASGNSKTVELGTGGAAGSTTTIVIGPGQPGAVGTVTLNGPTVTLGSNVTQFDMGSASARATAIGIGGATGDGTNRLSVNSPGILFNHAGSGVEASLNKATPTDQAMLSFKTGFSTRAQFGLNATDDLSLRISPDGSAFTTAFTADPATGRLAFPQPVILTGLATDPTPAPDGTLWHNAASGHLSTRLAGQTLHIDGQCDIPFLVPPVGELITTTTGMSGSATGTTSGAAGRIDLFPFLSRADLAIDRVLVNCTTSVLGALARVTLYASDALGRPAALITESADLDLGAAGSRNAAIALTLRQGRTYWIGLRTSSTAAVSAWSVSATPDINGGTTPQTTLRKVLRRTIAFTGAAPATWGFTSAEIASVSAPAIWLRLA